MRYRFAKGQCPSCHEHLRYLRVGHEARCEAFHSRRGARLVRIGLALLVLSTALIYFPWRAL